MRTMIGLAALVVATSGLVATATAPGQAASGAPECRNGNVTATYKGGDAATSHVYGRIVLTNTSTKTCWVQGYGGLSYVGGGDGSQVGAAADRAASTTPRVTLEPGDKVSSRVVETSYGPYPKAKCRPTAVDGFRVYLPDETRSQFIEHPTTGCGSTAVHLLEHKAFR